MYACRGAAAALLPGKETTRLLRGAFWTGEAVVTGGVEEEEEEEVETERRGAEALVSFSSILLNP